MGEYRWTDPLTGRGLAASDTVVSGDLYSDAVAREILRLARELKVERGHREAAERQRDDKAEEIRCLRAEREGLLKPPAPCVWTEDFGGTYATTCGDQHVLYEGTPAENGMNFCCYCGKPLAEVLWEETEPVSGDAHPIAGIEDEDWDGPPDDTLTAPQADAMTLEGVYGPEDL